MKLTDSYIALGLVVAIASASRAAPAVHNQALESVQTKDQGQDSGALKHPASACGGKITWGRFGPSGCRYTNGGPDPAGKVMLSSRAMNSDTHQETADKPNGQDVKGTLNHAQWSQYSSPWLDVTPEGAHSTDGVKDAKHEDKPTKSTTQPEDHHCHHHETGHNNNGKRNEEDKVHTPCQTNSHKRCKDHEHIHHHDHHDSHNPHYRAHNNANGGKPQQGPEEDSFAAQNYSW